MEEKTGCWKAEMGFWDLAVRFWGMGKGIRGVFRASGTFGVKMGWREQRMGHLREKWGIVGAGLQETMGHLG